MHAVTSPAIASEVDVVVIGAGAAGIAAGRRLAEAGVSFVLLEARDRIGGRAHTVTDVGPFPIDLGCGWLHSGDVNPWTDLAEAAGLTVHRTKPPWGSQARDLGFPPDDQAAFHAAMNVYFDQVHGLTDDAPDRAAAEFLPADGRWTPLIGAVSTYISGAEPERLSVRDLQRYGDTNRNWRVEEGYGTLVAAHGRDLPVRLNAPVAHIDHSDRRIRVEGPGGTVSAAAVIVTLPTALIAAGTPAFTPDLADKRAAAAGLPLGVANKVLLRHDRPADLPEGHVFGHVDRVRTGSYHLRPLGRPLIEGYFGGDYARDLEAEGLAGLAAAALDDLASLFGSAIRDRLTPVVSTAWASDRFAGGSYSFALPGHADDRAILAAPVDDRLFFAGEATSLHDFSTAHGAYRTGRSAAEAALAALGRPVPAA